MATLGSAFVQLRGRAVALVLLQASTLHAQSVADGGRASPAEAVSPQSGTQSPPDARGAEADVEATFWRADELFERGEYAEAAVWFSKALDLSRRPEVTGTWHDFSPNIAFNVAQSHRRAGNCTEARDAYVQYSANVVPLPSEHVAWFQGLLEQCPALQATQGSGVEARSPVTANPVTSAQPTEMGVTAPTAAGKWLLDVNAPGASSATDNEPSRLSPVWAGTAAGLAVVSAGAAVGFWVSADFQEGLAQNESYWDEVQRHQSAASSRRVWAGVFAGTAVLLGGASVFLFEQASAPPSGASLELRKLALRARGSHVSLTAHF